MNVPSNSCLPRLAFCSFCLGSLGDSSGSFRQQMNANARHSSTMKSPTRNVKILDRRKHHHFRSIRHSSIGSSVVTESPSQFIPNELCTWVRRFGWLCWFYLKIVEWWDSLLISEFSISLIDALSRYLSLINHALVSGHFDCFFCLLYITNSDEKNKLRDFDSLDTFLLLEFLVIDAHACYLRYWFCNIFSLFLVYFFIVLFTHGTAHLIISTTF